MFSRYFLALCLVAVFAAVASAEEVVSADVELQDAEERAGSASVVKGIIKFLFKSAAKNCLSEAAGQCKQHWKHPTQAISCAKNFLKANKGRCSVGK